MLTRIRFFSAALLLVGCASCSSQPASICQMSQNRHFWQGVEVSWRGEIIDVMAPPHGRGIYFTDYKCVEIVRLDPGLAPNLYSSADDLSGHLAVAQFAVSGRLSYRNGEIVLRPKSLKRISPWATDDEFKAYMEKRRATLIEMGLLKVPPP